MTLAIIRGVSPRFNECEITHIDRTPIDLGIARRQHQEYVETLKILGCEVIELPAEPDLPDSVFVEDTAFILPETAVLTRPGADSRKPETETIARALTPFINILRVTEPATVDGGDVLVFEKNIYIGLSTRSNPAAVEQIQSLLKEYGYTIIGVELKDCLHLKTAVTKVDDATLLINKHWVDAGHFQKYNLIEVDPSEPFAANCLPVNGKIIYPTSFPRTAEKLRAHGCTLRLVEVDELAKAEGAVTCCSLILP